MRRFSAGVASAAVFAWVATATGQQAPAGGVVRELLRQQSAAERAGCAAIARALGSGTDPALVVRTAVELGYNPCQVIRCALEGRCEREGAGADLARVLQGAVAAGVPEDIIARCSVEACADPAAVAALLADLLLEPSYCYFAPREPGAPVALPPVQPLPDRDLPEISPYRF